MSYECDYGMPESYRPPAPDKVDVTDHAQLIDMTKYFGVAPGDTLIICAEKMLLVVEGCPVDGVPVVLVRTGIADSEWWAAVSVSAIDDTHTAFAVQTSATLGL